MPKALVINPNTSAAMTREIKETTDQLFRPPWSVEVRAAPAGPESLESWSDYYLASVCVLPLIAEMSDVDGVVLACFGDPGLYVLKESCEVPVVGIAEASIALSTLIGAKFGILAGMGRAVALMDNMVQTYGMGSRYAGSVSLGMRVLEFERDRNRTLKNLERASEAARKRGAEVLLLGCAGLTGFVAELQENVQMPVIDPVEAGCRMLHALVAGGYNTSHSGLFARPAEQNMIDLEKIFSSGAIQAIQTIRKS